MGFAGLCHSDRGDLSFPVVAPNALAHQDKQKQNVNCVENTPAIFTPKRDVSILMKMVQKIFCCCFNMKQTQLKTLKAATKRNRHSLDSCEQDDCQLQGTETNPFRKYSCRQTAPLKLLSP